MPKQPGKHTTVYNISWSTLLQSQLQPCTSCVYGHRYYIIHPGLEMPHVKLVIGTFPFEADILKFCMVYHFQ